MTATIGTYTIALAALAAGGAALLGVAAARQQRADLLELGRRCMMLFLALLTVACGALWVALLNSDFSIAYDMGFSSSTRSPVEAGAACEPEPPPPTDWIYLPLVRMGP